MKESQHEVSEAAGRRYTPQLRQPACSSCMGEYGSRLCVCVCLFVCLFVCVCVCVRACLFVSQSMSVSASVCKCLCNPCLSNRSHVLERLTPRSNQKRFQSQTLRSHQIPPSPPPNPPQTQHEPPLSPQPPQLPPLQASWTAIWSSFSESSGDCRPSWTNGSRLEGTCVCSTFVEGQMTKRALQSPEVRLYGRSEKSLLARLVKKLEELRL